MIKVITNYLKSKTNLNDANAEFMRAQASVALTNLPIEYVDIEEIPVELGKTSDERLNNYIELKKLGISFKR